MAILFFLNYRFLILLKEWCTFLALLAFLVPAAWKAYVMTGAPAAILDNKVFLNMKATAWLAKPKTSRSLDLIIMDLLLFWIFPLCAARTEH